MSQQQETNPYQILIFRNFSNLSFISIVVQCLLDININEFALQSRSTVFKCNCILYRLSLYSRQNLKPQTQNIGPRSLIFFSNIYSLKFCESETVRSCQIKIRANKRKESDTLITQEKTRTGRRHGTHIRSCYQEGILYKKHGIIYLSDINKVSKA